MTISSTGLRQPNALPTGRTRPAAAPPPQAESRGTRLQDLFRFGQETPKIDIALTGEEYQDIGDRDAARMLGWFTQKMQDQGFPWKLYTPPEGNLARKQACSELEALARLRGGQPVLFQPRRALQLDFSPDSIGALAAVGALRGGDVTGLQTAAALSKTSKVTPGNQGMELDFGAPVMVKSFSELKLLFQMYNPEAPFKAENPIGKAAHQLTYFTQKTLGGAFPWRFYEKSDDNVVARVLKAAVRRGVAGALIGAGLGAVVGGPVGLFTGSWTALKTLAMMGGTIGGVFGAVDAGRVAAKGKELNAVQTLERVLEGKPVTFQETQMRSIGVPVLGKISWFSDYGKGSEIGSAQDLETFYWMQDQAAKLPEPAKPPEAPKKDGKKVPATLTIGDQQYGLDLTPIEKKPNPQEAQRPAQRPAPRPRGDLIVVLETR